MKDLIKRLTSDTPTFFKRLRNLGITIGAIGGALLAIPTSVVVLPAVLLTLAAHAVTLGVVTAAVSQAVTPKEEVKTP